MKLDLNENTLNIYLTEAIKQELDEGMFTFGGTTYRVILPMMGIPHNAPKFKGALKTGKDVYAMAEGSFGSGIGTHLKAKGNLFKKGKTANVDTYRAAALITALRNLGYDDQQILDGIVGGAIQVGKWDGENFTPWEEEKQRKHLAVPVMIASNRIKEMAAEKYGDDIREWEGVIAVTMSDSPNKDALADFFDKLGLPGLAGGIREFGIDALDKAENFLDKVLDGVGTSAMDTARDLNQPIDVRRQQKGRPPLYGPESRPTNQNRSPEVKTNSTNNRTNGSNSGSQNGAQGSKSGSQNNTQMALPQLPQNTIQQREGPPVVQNPNIANKTLPKSFGIPGQSGKEEQPRINTPNTVTVPNQNQMGLKLKESKIMGIKENGKMKYRLTEEETIAYINEAIRQELNEETWIQKALRKKAARKAAEQGTLDALRKAGLVPQEAGEAIGEKKPGFWSKLTGSNTRKAKKGLEQAEKKVKREMGNIDIEMKREMEILAKKTSALETLKNELNDLRYQLRNIEYKLERKGEELNAIYKTAKEKGRGKLTQQEQMEVNRITQERNELVQQQQRVQKEIATKQQEVKAADAEIDEQNRKIDAITIRKNSANNPVFDAQDVLDQAREDTKTAWKTAAGVSVGTAAGAGTIYGIHKAKTNSDNKSASTARSAVD